MDIVSLKEMVAHEEEAFRSGITAAALMEVAGQAMAERIIELYPHAENYLLFIGKGNNGGDGLVVARYLLSTRKPVKVVLTAPEDKLGALPQTHLARLRVPYPNLEIVEWTSDLEFPNSKGVVIDALLGIQARGALRGTLHDVIPQMNYARATQFFRTVALDLPTGLAAFEEISGPHERDDAVIADVTLAVGFAKEVLTREALSAWVGRIEVIPWSKFHKTSSPQQVLVASDLSGLLPRRSSFSHKGDFGRLAIIAGRLGFSGAPVLCSQAAQAMGTGLLSVITRPDAVNIVASQAPPEAMVSAWPEKGDVPEAVQHATAIVLGPGLGTDTFTTKMLRAVLAIGCPVLIDADGLTVLAKKLDLLQDAKGPVILTPHPGEMARLIGRPFGPDEREAVAKAFTDHYHVTLVLKGTRTIIASSGAPLYINTTGNPGLSTGGSGDTLSGIIGALLAQGLTPMNAARLGVWMLGHSADLALADRGCEEGLTPSQLSAHIGAALVSLRAQAIPPVALLERLSS